MWLLITEIKSKLSNLAQHCWYLDDGILAGPETERSEALEILTVSGTKCGLELRKDKCGLWLIEDIN